MNEDKDNNINKDTKVLVSASDDIYMSLEECEELSIPTPEYYDSYI